MVEKLGLAIAITFALNVVHGLSAAQPQSKTLLELHSAPQSMVSLLSDPWRP
jgi:hypothetical protein